MARNRKTKTVWAPGFRKANLVEAEVAKAEVDKIRDANGGNVTPDDVVETAKDAASPLHSLFEWSNAKAAKEYRLEQARSMLRAIHVVRTDHPEKGSRREFEVLPGVYSRGDTKPYRSVDEMMEDPETRVALLQRALNELVSFQRKYRGLQELAVVFRAVEDVLHDA